MSNSKSDLLTIDTLCARLHVSRNTAYHLLTTKKIEAFKVGRTWRIPIENVEAFVTSQMNTKKEDIHHE